MNTNHALHKWFLIFMFSACSLAVIFLVRGEERVSAQTSNDGVLNTTTYVAGTCGSAHLKTTSTKPSGDALCSSGQAKDFYSTNTGWRWRCEGSGATSTNNVAVCESTLEKPSAPIVAGTCGSANGKTLTDKPTDSKALCSTGMVYGFKPTDTGWTWLCVNTAGLTGLTASCGAKLVAVPTPNSVSANTADDGPVTAAGDDTSASGQTATSSTQNIEATLTSKKTETIKIDEQDKDDAVANTSLKKPTFEDVKNDSLANQQLSAMEKNPSKPTIQRSEIVRASMIIEAKNLTSKKNPKVSGKVSESLKIENVALNKKTDEKSNVFLTGKAEPGALVTIYVFSKDPVVITIKADENGNWNYELDKELADGQHEAYVAVTDDEGRIVSKSEPIAFVKTAQAATLIPMSEFTGNQSPIENSVKQYVLMAIIIMSVCLVIALISIGFLTHGRNKNEGIN